MNPYQTMIGTKKICRSILSSFLLPAAVMLISSLLLSGCAEVKIPVYRHLYRPELPKSVTQFYKGKQIDMNSFENHDEMTKRWTYFSPDKKIAYVASVPLEYFVLDCFRDAFWLAGASVLKDSHIVSIPNLSIIIDHWTDQEFIFTATVMKDNALKFRNQYTITAPAANMNDTAKLEKNVYEMMNKAVLAVMTDPKFQIIFK
jgi:hypothetical protein